MYLVSSGEVESRDLDLCHLVDELSLSIKPQISLVYELMEGADDGGGLSEGVVRDMKNVLFSALNQWNHLCEGVTEARIPRLKETLKANRTQ